MRLMVLPAHEGLCQATRLPWLQHTERALPALEWAGLMLFGGLAACASIFWDWGLRMPGHSILQAVFPMVCGLAVVPRRGAGSVMGAGALLTWGALHWGGHVSTGFGSTTSLLLTGPLMDAALWTAKPGRRLYLSFALAGLAANGAAFAMRGTVKYFGWEGVTKRPFAAWWPEAVFTYALCGVLAGLISAAVWFHATGHRESSAPPDQDQEPTP